jgi:hypothetical protein
MAFHAAWKPLLLKDKNDGLQNGRRPEPQAGGKNLLLWNERFLFGNKSANLRSDGKLKLAEIGLLGSLDLGLYLI